MRNRKDKIFALVAAGCLCLSGLTGCGEIKMSPDNISSKSDDGLMGSVKEETDASDESEADAAGEEDKVSNDMIGRYGIPGIREPILWLCNCPPGYVYIGKENESRTKRGYHRSL